MSRVRLGCVFAALLFSPSMILAKDIAAELAALQARSPDVGEWKKVTEGYYRGKGTDGSLVTVLAGREGAKIALAENEERLFELNGLAESNARTGKSDAALTKLVSEIASAEAERDGLLRVIGTDTVAKASQYLWHNISTCGWVNAAVAEFEATPSGSAFINVTSRASYGDIGAITPGPPPYQWPEYYTRVANAGVVVDLLVGFTDTETATHEDAFFAEVTRPAASRHCTVNTRHSYTFKCVDSPEDFYEIRRSNTCANVVSNTPPNVVITP